MFTPACLYIIYSITIQLIEALERSGPLIKNISQAVGILKSNIGRIHLVIYYQQHLE